MPLVTEELDEHQDNKGPLYDPKQDVFVSLFVSFSFKFCFSLRGGQRSQRNEIWVIDCDIVET